MATHTTSHPNAFDFSLDATMFRQRLWLQLKAQLPHASMQLLDDDDLAFIHAAGMINASLIDDELPEE